MSRSAELGPQIRPEIRVMADELKAPVAMITELRSCTTGYVATPDGRVWFKKVNGGRGLPLIVLHGGPAFPSDYLESLQAACSERPVIFYDQLGCGRSDWPDPHSKSLWRIERFVEELELVRENLDVQRFHLFGNSWGAMLGLEYYLQSPARVVSLVFSSPCLSTKRWAVDAQRLRAEMGPSWCELTARHEAAGTTSSVEYREAEDAFMKRFVCRKAPWPGEFLRAKAGFNEAVYQVMWGPSEFAPSGTLKEYTRENDLSKIRVPTLFTCGRFDEATPETVALYRSRVPGAKQAVFENSAHLAFLEEPGSYLNILNEFLYRNEKPGD